MLDPYKLQDLIHQTRARVSWGEERDAIAKWLADEGVAPNSIDEILDAAFREREEQVRQLGISEIVKGLLIAAASGGGLFWIFNSAMLWRNKRLVAIGIAGALVGIVRLVRGLLWLAHGKNVRGSVGDLDQSA